MPYSADTRPHARLASPAPSPESISAVPDNVGVVVIGRNEGHRLAAALSSIPDSLLPNTIYVDSGSTDSSVSVAREHGVAVHELDDSKPFSPARGRSEGASQLLAKRSNINWIQFLDGDCELHENWIGVALSNLATGDDIGIVCGMLSEKYPEASIYNHLKHTSWSTRPGDTASCGGNFMIRRDIYIKAGGFNPALLTREEEDLCERVRNLKMRVTRVDAPMVLHDAGLTTFLQWWRRAVWGGFGDAIQIKSDTTILKARHLKRIARYFAWSIGIPGLLLASIVGTAWQSELAILSLICVTVYALQVARTIRWRLKIGDSSRHAVMYALLSLLRRIAVGYGFFLCLTGMGRSGWPDPHRAN